MRRLRHWLRDRLLRLDANARASPRYEVAETDYGPLVVNRNDLYIGRSLLRSGTFDDAERQALAELVARRLRRQSRVVVVDAGANVGAYSIAISRRFAGQALVHAIEAQAEMFRLLSANVALNGAETIRCHHKAVSDRDGDILSFLAPDYDVENNFGGLEVLPPAWSDNADMVRGGREEVVTATIDSLAPDADIIKLDIEGMELRALSGARRTIATNRPFVICEMVKSDHAAIERFFAEHGYRGETLNQSKVFLPDDIELPGR